VGCSARLRSKQKYKQLAEALTSTGELITLRQKAIDEEFAPAKVVLVPTGPCPFLAGKLLRREAKLFLERPVKMLRVRVAQLVGNFRHAAAAPQQQVACRR
jgi:hypothetical protein